MARSSAIRVAVLRAYCAIVVVLAPTIASAQTTGPAELYRQHLRGLQASAGAARAEQGADSARFRIEETAPCQIAFYKDDDGEADPMSLSENYFNWQLVEDKRLLRLHGPRDFYFDDTATAVAMAAHMLELRFLCEDGPDDRLRPAARAAPANMNTDRAPTIRNLMEVALAPNGFQFSALESDDVSATFSISRNQQTYFVHLTDCRAGGACGLINYIVLIGALTPEAVDRLDQILRTLDFHVRLVTVAGESGPVYGLHRAYSAWDSPVAMSSDFLKGGRSFAAEVDRALSVFGSATAN